MNQQLIRQDISYWSSYACLRPDGNDRLVYLPILRQVYCAGRPPTPAKGKVENWALNIAPTPEEEHKAWRKRIDQAETAKRVQTLKHPALIEENLRRQQLGKIDSSIILPRCFINLTPAERMKFGPKPVRLLPTDPIIVKEHRLRKAAPLAE